jgi:uncharacterized membrane protein
MITRLAGGRPTDSRALTQVLLVRQWATPLQFIVLCITEYSALDGMVVMNLDMSALGWLHSLACVIALAGGLFNIVTPKGTRLHRRVGDAFTITLVIVCVSALGIYKQHRFWFPHWDALATLALLAIGWSSARYKWPRRGWIYLHLTTMLLSYYMLIGGGVNEVFLRVDVLHRMVGANFFATKVIGETQALVMLAFVVLIPSFVIATVVGRQRRRARAEGVPA